MTSFSLLSGTPQQNTEPPQQILEPLYEILEAPKFRKELVYQHISAVFSKKKKAKKQE